MLIDTRELPPDPEPGGGEPWWAELPRRLRWSVIFVGLIIASYATDGWISLGLAYAALLLAVWRGLNLMPTTGGMKDYHQ
jgi:hypothetical protein